MNSWRSSSRRSCQNPRLIIATIADDDEQVERRSSGAENRNPYMRRRLTVAPPVPVPGAAGTVGEVELPGLPPPARREDRVDGGDRRVRRRAGPPRCRRPIRRARRTPTRSGSRPTSAFPEVVVFGLTPVAARGLLGLVADAAPRRHRDPGRRRARRPARQRPALPVQPESTSSGGASGSPPPRPGTAASRSRSSS